MKRVAIATVFGIVAGLLCTVGVMNMGVKLTHVSFIWILLNRTMLGFVIGISGLRLHWALHGLLLGAIVGLLFSYYWWMSGSGTVLILSTFLASIVFGLLIELFTTVVFKQPQPTLVQVSQAAKAQSTTV